MFTYCLFLQENHMPDIIMKMETIGDFSFFPEILLE
jgi:hypothetical protein